MQKLDAELMKVSSPGSANYRKYWTHAMVGEPGQRAHVAAVKSWLSDVGARRRGPRKTARRSADSSSSEYFTPSVLANFYGIPPTTPLKNRSSADAAPTGKAASSQAVFETAYDPFLKYAMDIADMEHPILVSSISWGSIEPANPLKVMEAFNAEVAKIGLMGSTVFVSSGDDGANSYLGCAYMPSYPATSPYVTAVGATFAHDWDGEPGFPNEVVCQSDTYFANLNAAEKPYEGFAEQGRGYPDLSLRAGYEVVIGGLLYIVCGTSCSSPSVAGMVGRINADRLAEGKPPVGFNPTLYRAPAVAADPGCGPSDGRWLNATGAWRVVRGPATPSSVRCSEDERCAESRDCGASPREAFGDRCVAWMRRPEGLTGDRGSYAGFCDSWALSRSCVYDPTTETRSSTLSPTADEELCACSLPWDAYNVYAPTVVDALPGFEGEVSSSRRRRWDGAVPPCFAHWLQDELFPLYWTAAEDAGSWDFDRAQYALWFTEQVGGGFRELAPHVSCGGAYAHASTAARGVVTAHAWGATTRRRASTSRRSSAGCGARALVGGAGGRRGWDSAHYAKGRALRQKVDAAFDDDARKAAYDGFVEALRRAVAPAHVPLTLGAAPTGTAFRRSQRDVGLRDPAAVARAVVRAWQAARSPEGLDAAAARGARGPGGNAPGAAGRRADAAACARGPEPRRRAPFAIEAPAAPRRRPSPPNPLTRLGAPTRLAADREPAPEADPPRRSRARAPEAAAEAAAPPPAAPSPRVAGRRSRRTSAPPPTPPRLRRRGASPSRRCPGGGARRRS
ncbi:serine-type peptidase [Aureococcus anophagefferens]|nr:serine-type peptidase [Aureococcus anophagefferens]